MLMWRRLQQDDGVFVGDTIRFCSGSQVKPLHDEVYRVVKTDQHYFEIIRKIEISLSPESFQRKIVRFIDIGYNILLERWTDMQGRRSPA